MEPGPSVGRAVRVPYVDLGAEHKQLREELLEAVARVFDHGQFILGPEVRELEHALARRLSVASTVGVSSGTDALALALRARGIGPGDEVITVSHSFVATAAAIGLVGATPVFVDIDPDTMVMSAPRVASCVTERTRAVLPVHLNGIPCDLDALEEICVSHRLALIEDCAQALGARWGKRPVGSTGLGAFSLHPLKILAACGDAGVVAVRDPRDDEILRQLRNLGLVDRDRCGTLSGNSRLDTVQAAILLVKLGHLDQWQDARRAHQKAYEEALSGVVRFPRLPPEAQPVVSCLAVRHPERDRILEVARQRGVDLKIHYPIAIHQQPPFAACPRDDLVETERTVREIFSLPVSPTLTAVQRDFVIETIREAVA